MHLPKKPQLSTLDYLPFEILLHILQNLDLTTLRTLLRTYRRSRTIFSTYHTQIVSHILSSTLYDPLFPLYFPYYHKSTPYPLPSDLPPLETSHHEAYTHLRYAKSLISLSSIISTLTSHISSIVTPPILPHLLPPGIEPLNNSALAPYERLITSTIHRSLIIFSQTRFYSPSPFLLSQAYVPPPRPCPPLYPEHVARNLVTRAILPKETSSDTLLLQLSDTHASEVPEFIQQTHRFLRRLILLHLTRWFKNHKIYKESCIIQSWEYMHDNVGLRDNLFFYLTTPPSLILKLILQCKAEDEYQIQSESLTDPDVRAAWEKREKKRYNSVASQLGTVYKIACEVTHEYLAKRKKLEEIGLREVVPKGVFRANDDEVMLDGGRTVNVGEEGSDYCDIFAHGEELR